MTTNVAEKITKALDVLDAAISAAAVAVSAAPARDEMLVKRMESYREVVRRQRVLALDLSRAKQSGDLREVSRLANLLQASSAMIKLDLSNIAESLGTLKAMQQERAAA